MNDKLSNHVNILFAAAPRNQKAEEIKEELLTNLNDKYNDLLSNGYDSTAAFHIALSGIGDIDELFRECGGTVQADTPSIIPKPQASQMPMYAVFAFNLFVVLPAFPILVGSVGRYAPDLYGIFFLWTFAGSVLIYAIASSFAARSGKADSTPVSPMFSKRKVLHTLFCLVLAFGTVVVAETLGLRAWLGWLVAMGFYIVALVSLVKKEPKTIVIPAKAGIQTGDLNLVSLAPRLRGGDGENGVTVLFPAPKSRLPMWLGLIAALIVSSPFLALGVPSLLIPGGLIGLAGFLFFLGLALPGGLIAFAITYAIVWLCTGGSRQVEVQYQRQILSQAEQHGFSQEFVQNEIRAISRQSKLRHAVLILLIVFLSLFIVGGIAGVVSVVNNVSIPGWINCGVVPTGPVIIEEREIGDLSNVEIIDVHSALSVEFRMSDQDSIVVETHEDMMTSIVTDVRNNTLTIRQDSRVRYRNVQKLLVTVYSRNVPKVFYTHAASRLTCEEPIKVEGVSLYASGASQLRFKSIESTSSINFKLDGASSAEVAGSAESIHVQARGASQLRASNLDVKHCDVEISGASRVEVGNIGGELSISASGASHFSYRGTPTIKRQDVTGASRINAR